ncbi:hypothetical protein [uncultured Fibrobacter sp.]|uniref:hypothetical protein n=1 Tax=uncultured Fibrobacter sp. TaxID=261512 RepID=UPI0025FD6086|nr:hypothetical protein [uncultured Fibrobacter sp.]
MVIGFDYNRKKKKWAFPAPLRGPGYILAATVFASLAAYLLKRRHSAAKGLYPYRKNQIGNDQEDYFALCSFLERYAAISASTLVSLIPAAALH